jgi:hypothetical protein
MKVAGNVIERSLKTFQSRQRTAYLYSESNKAQQQA